MCFFRALRRIKPNTIAVNFHLLTPTEPGRQHFVDFFPPNVRNCLFFPLNLATYAYVTIFLRKLLTRHFISEKVNRRLEPMLLCS